MNKIHAKSWKGTDNIHRDVEVVPDLLRNSANLDFTADNKVVSRVGYTQLSSGAASSGFGFGPYLVYIRGGSLRALHTVTGVVTTLFAVSSAKLGRVVIDGFLYVSDGVSKWKVSSTLQVSDWGTVAADDPTFDARFVIDFPACNKLAYWKGRMFGRVGNLVVYSLPYVYGSFDPRRNYFPVQGTVNVLHGNDNTLFIGANEVFALGEVGGALSLVFPGSSIDAEPTIDEETGEAFWINERGLVSVAKSGAEVNLVTDGPVALRPAASAAIGFTKRSGALNIIAAMIPDSSVNEQHPLVAEDYLRSEEIRKEIFNALQL